MKPFVIMSDNHAHLWTAYSEVNKDGLNSRLSFILDEIDRAAKACVKIGGRRVFGAGDLFHVRGVISPSVINPLKDRFERLHKELGVEFVLIPGNHDLEMNDSLTIGSATKSLSSVPGVLVVDKPTLFLEEHVAILPWRDKMDDLREDIVIAQAECKSYGGADKFNLIIHAPVNGVISGIPDHGFYAEELSKYGFGRVFAGHYHNHKKFDGLEVYSCGATTHQTWSDVGTLAGFVAVTSKGVQHVESLAPKFVEMELDWSEEECLERCEGNYVKVRLGEATEKEITMIRERVKADFKAKVCIVEAVPARSVVERAGGTVKSGMTMSESVKAYIDGEEFTTDKEKIFQRASEIILQAEGEVL